MAVLPAAAALESCVCPPAAKLLRVAEEHAFPKGELEKPGSIRRKLATAMDPSKDPPGNSTPEEGRHLAEWTLERIIHDIKRILVHGKPENGGSDIRGGGSMQDVNNYIKVQEAILSKGEKRPLGALVSPPVFVMKDAVIVGIVIEGCILLEGKAHTDYKPYIPKPANCAEAKNYYETNKNDKRVNPLGDIGHAVTNHLVYSSSSSSSYWGLP